MKFSQALSRLFVAITLLCATMDGRAAWPNRANCEASLMRWWASLTAPAVERKLQEGLIAYRAGRGSFEDLIPLNQRLILAQTEGRSSSHRVPDDLKEVYPPQEENPFGEQATLPGFQLLPIRRNGHFLGVDKDLHFLSGGVVAVFQYGLLVAYAFLDSELIISELSPNGGRPRGVYSLRTERRLGIPSHNSGTASP